MTLFSKSRSEKINIFHKEILILINHRLNFGNRFFSEVSEFLSILK
jgi:hypothetical protein